jgi:hypothetical protein
MGQVPVTGRTLWGPRAMARSSCVAVHGAVLQTVPMRRGVVGGGGGAGCQQVACGGERGWPGLGAM